MKRLIIILLTVIIGVTFTACNYDVVDLTYEYNYAYIKLQDGQIISGKVESWRDYEDGEQLQVKVDGVTYLTNSYNCTLVYNPELG